MDLKALNLLEEEQARKKRKVWAWSSAMIGVILFNVSIAFLSVSKSSAWGWALFGAGLAFLVLALHLVRCSH